MKKIEFKNYEDSPTTPINAQALNAMQDNMEEAINNIAPNQEIIISGNEGTWEYEETGLYYGSFMGAPYGSGALSISTGLLEVINLGDGDVFQRFSTDGKTKDSQYTYNIDTFVRFKQEDKWTDWDYHGNKPSGRD